MIIGEFTMKKTEFGSSEAGKLGGKARADQLLPAERSEIARRAAEKRWNQRDVLSAKYGDPSSPLRIPNAENDVPIEIPCYVLEDKTRVLVQAGMLHGLDMSQGTAGRSGDRLTGFIATKSINPFVSEHLRDMITNPIRFRVPSGSLAYGYEATILADLCDAVLAARKHGQLNYQQEHIAERCEILVRGFARVGIIALVDEATGYQRDRERDELANILEAFVAKEIQQWIKTFDLEFYELICEVRKEPLARASNRPQYFGKITNNLIYQRLAPGVLDELRRLNPVNNNGRRVKKHFQYLTPTVGHPKLKEHLAGVITALKLAKIQDLGWKQFLALLDKTHPKWHPMPLFDDQDGSGVDL
jgi:hypothetical protein